MVWVGHIGTRVPAVGRWHEDGTRREAEEVQVANGLMLLLLLLLFDPAAAAACLPAAYTTVLAECVMLLALFRCILWLYRLIFGHMPIDNSYSQLWCTIG